MDKADQCLISRGLTNRRFCCRSLCQYQREELMIRQTLGTFVSSSARLGKQALRLMMGLVV